jgi:hypothetical protein
VALKKGYRGTAGLLRYAQNVRMATARARVRAAEAVVPRPTVTGEELSPELPGVAAAVAEAAVTDEHVRMIQDVLAMVPPHLAEHRPALEGGAGPACTHSRSGCGRQAREAA